MEMGADNSRAGYAQHLYTTVPEVSSWNCEAEQKSHEKSKLPESAHSWSRKNEKKKNYYAVNADLVIRDLK